MTEIQLEMKTKYIGPEDNLEWIDGRLKHMLGEYGRYDNLDYILDNRYGDPTRETKTKKTWVQPKWTVSITRTTKTMTFAWEPVCDTLEQAYDLITEFCLNIGLRGTSKLLKGSEEAALLQTGWDIIQPYQMKLKDYSTEAMNRFVLRYMEGLIFTDRHCRGTDVGLIFMPMIFGALSVPDEVWEKIEDVLPPDPGDRPEIPNRPERGEYPTEPIEPVRPAEILPDPERLANIKSRIEWQQATKEEREIYLAEILKQNKNQDKMFDEEHQLWKAACQKVKDEIRQINTDYAAAMTDFRLERSNLQDKLDAWELADVKHMAARKGVIQGYTQNLGIVWEDYSEAGPRSVNGCPIFFSMNLMSKADWKRACKAIDKEQKRRERMST